MLQSSQKKHHERATADTRVRISSRKDRKFLTRKTSSSGALALGAELIREPRASDAVEDVDAAGCSCGASPTRKNQKVLSGERNSGEKTARQRQSSGRPRARDTVVDVNTVGGAWNSVRKFRAQTAALCINATVPLASPPANTTSAWAGSEEAAGFARPMLNAEEDHAPVSTLKMSTRSDNPANREEKTQSRNKLSYCTFGFIASSE